MMNLDDLKSEWQARDQRLEKSIQFNTRLLWEAYVDKQGSVVRRKSLFGFLVQIPVYLITISCLGLFMIHHVGEPDIFATALLLEGWCIAMWIALLYQFQSLYSLDFSQPVMGVQKQLTKVRMARLRTFKWGFLSGMLLWWIPFLIVIAKAIANVDLYAVAPEFVMYQEIGTAMLAALTLWISKRYATKFERSTFVNAFFNTIAGTDITAANAYLHKLSSFEQETDYANTHAH